jgi:N-acetyl-anhydromuramyl-L-alanine amidase AmpD
MMAMADARLRFFTATPSPNRGGTCRVPGDVRGIVIHSVEGTMASACATFAKVGGASAHYGIDRDGTVVTFVPEGDVAFHVAAFGNRPTLNRYQPDWLPAYDGRWSAVNACTVGIELAGFAGKPFTAAQYASLGALCAGIATRWGFVPDASRVVSHASLQTDRSDPGDGFDWATLFAEIRAARANSMSTITTSDERAILHAIADTGYPASEAAALIRAAHAWSANAASLAEWIEKIGALEIAVAERDARIAALETAQRVSDA